MISILIHFCKIFYTISHYFYMRLGVRSGVLDRYLTLGSLRFRAPPLHLDRLTHELRPVEELNDLPGEVLIELQEGAALEVASGVVDHAHVAQASKNFEGRAERLFVVVLQVLHDDVRAAPGGAAPLLGSPVPGRYRYW